MRKIYIFHRHMYPLCTHELSTALLHASTCSTRNFLIKLALLLLIVVVKMAVLMLYLNSLYLLTRQPILSILILSFRLRHRLFHSRFPAKILYVFLTSNAFI
jgi:hypothetical protein